MLNVYIVEDEYFIRAELLEIIDWSKYGFKIVGQATNGKEAYEYLKNNNVDLIITDIEMPFLTGIELVSKLREEDINTEIVFLTAYSEFTYAQQGVKLGVIDYLLKPVEEDQLIRCLEKVFSKINNKEEPLDESTINIGYKKNIILKAQEYIRQNIAENITLAAISDYLNISKNYFCTLYKKETGENLSDSIAKEKIKIAKEMLTKDNLKVYEVCDRLGYLDTTSFSKMFRKVVGVTPVEFKRNGDRDVIS